MLTRILLLINDDITGQQDVLVVSGQDLLDLEALETFHLELYIVAGEEVREESLLVNDPHQCPIEVEGVIGLALPADYTEVSLVETLYNQGYTTNTTGMGAYRSPYWGHSA